MTIFRKLLAAVPLLLLTPGSFAIPTVSCPGVAPNWTCSVTSCGTNTWDVTINRANLGAGETATVLIACNTGDKICNLTVGTPTPVSPSTSASLRIRVRRRSLVSRTLGLSAAARHPLSTRVV